MKITFLGANHEVTGSCTLLEAAGRRFLIDCGMEQGKNVYENQPIPVAPGEIDWVLATHAHIDHTGMLPLLVRNGFRGKIYATNPTVELCGIMLRDSAHIQEFEAEWKNRKAQRSGAEPVEPMYTVQDAEAAMKLFVGVDYEKRIELAPGIEVRFVDVGHLLGSASIELWITEGDTTTKLVFSGDIGNLDQPIIKDPAYISEADYVFMESTYGDRLHGPRPDYVNELAKILQRTFDRGGNVVVPSFAVGRTQEMLYFLREIKEKGLVKGHGNFPVYIDSPLATEATRIFRDTDPDCFDEQTRALLEQAGWQQLEGQPWRQKAGQPLAIELAFIGTDALAKSMAEIIQANLRQVGVQVTLVGEEESSIYARQREGRFGMIFNRTWGAPYDPHAFLSSMRVPSHADYQAQRGLPDKALIDKEINEVLTTGDEAQRRKLYHDVLTRLHQDAVYLPISYVSLMSVARQEVGEIPFAPVTSEIPFDQITPVTP